MTYNKYFWSGNLIAKYQNKTGLSYYDIEKKIPFKKIIALYQPLHEADIRKIYNVLDSFTNPEKNETNLKKNRLASGLSQSELSRLSNVKLSDNGKMKM